MFLSDGRRPLDAFPEVARQYGKLPLFIDMVLIYETFDVMPEFLWPNIPGYAAFRKKQDGKWFAVIGSVPRCKVDPISLSGEDVEVINVKVDSEMIEDTSENADKEIGNMDHADFSLLLQEIEHH